MFINYENGEIKIKSYRNPSAISGEVGDILSAIELEKSGAECCLLDGAKEALEDGQYLGSIDVTEDAVETLYAAIQKHACA